MPRAKNCKVLHVSYYPSLSKTREAMLQEQGHVVTSALGNDNAKELADAGDFDVAVVGFSGRLQDRTEIVSWLKKRRPELPVIALQAHTERSPEADQLVPGHDPHAWLEAVRASCPS